MATMKTARPAGSSLPLTRSRLGENLRHANRLGAPAHAQALLDLDADLGEAIPAAEYETARRRSAVRVVRVDGPRLDPSDYELRTPDQCLGLFLVEGVVVHRVVVSSRAACELLGTGELCRPWDEDGDYTPLPIKVDWLVLGSARMAVLDRDFALRMAPWPSVFAKLMQRAAARPRHLAVGQAVTHLTRSHTRLLLMFWLLAERWGKVVRDGVVIELPLTHQLLAMIVGNRRPSVTIALARLRDDGLLIRQAPDRWLLTRKAIACLNDPGSCRG